jgi:hypothetical protein
MLACYARCACSCAGVTTVACIARAGGSSTALRRRGRLRGTCRARCFSGSSCNGPVLARNAVRAIDNVSCRFPHACYTRCACSCAGVATVACIASAGGSSTALRRRDRVRGTIRARCFSGSSWSGSVLARNTVRAIDNVSCRFPHACYTRCAISCAGVATVACIASAGGSSTALSRRGRVRGTCRAG